MISPGVQIVAVLAAAAIFIGWAIPPDFRFDPHSGVGYWLGWTGAGLMSLLFSYSIHKRFHWAKRVGKTTEWFNIHQILGLAGPIVILWHCGYSLGAVNSNIALFSMLVVSASGIIGRYLKNTPGMERLFALWHVAHLPIVFIMIMSIVAHVISVHMY